MKSSMVPLAHLVRPLGYDVVHRSPLSKIERSLDAADSDDYRQWQTPSPIWTPWLADREFRDVFEQVKPHTIVPVDHCHVLWSLARQARQLPGDFAECGVYRGGTALLLATVLRDSGRTLHLFDSFEGLPNPDPNGDARITFDEGTFQLSNSEANEVRRVLSLAPCNIDLHVGWIPGTFDGLEDRRFALVHVDVDFYQATLAACEFFYPRLVEGAVMVFDEYGFASTRGEKVAVDEFFADLPETVLPLRGGQAIAVKLPSGRPKHAP